MTISQPTIDAQATLFEKLRSTEYQRLDDDGHVYLDYTGGGLFAASQLREHVELLQSTVLGNPHSVNPTSSTSTQLVERARAAVLAFFNASPDEYVAIFTPNATGALRLVGEAYPFHAGDRFLLTFDNHNSVNGIREFARARGAAPTYVPSVAPDLRVDEDLFPRYLSETSGHHHNLFAFPAQSNFSGVQHPLDWIAESHLHGWDVLLDAAAFVPTNRLDLSHWHPDFVALSFYKMFGWPTGLGCLIGRREALAKLERPWFSGGTIVAAFVGRQYSPGGARCGALRRRHRQLPQHPGGGDRPSASGPHRHGRHPRACRRARRRAAGRAGVAAPLATARPATTIYGPRSWEQRGSTIAFNFLHPDGRVVDERYVDRVAARHNVSLRTGCFCNPGAGEVAFTISRETLLGGEFGDGMTLDDYMEVIGLPTGGAVRASLGIASNSRDVQRFLVFASEFIDLPDAPEDLPPRVAC